MDIIVVYHKFHYPVTALLAPLRLIHTMQYLLFMPSRIFLQFSNHNMSDHDIMMTHMVIKRLKNEHEIHFNEKIELT